MANDKTVNKDGIVAEDKTMTKDHTAANEAIYRAQEDKAQAESDSRLAAKMAAFRRSTPHAKETDIRRWAEQEIEAEQMFAQKQQAAAARRQAEAQARFAQWVKIPRALKDKRFADLTVTQDNAAHIKTCRDYLPLVQEALADKYADRSRYSLYMMGPVGRGKTWLAAVTANEMQAAGYNVAFVSATEILQAIKSTFSDNSGAEEAKLLNLFKTAQLLVIDDLGKERCSEWSLSKLFEIINARCGQQLPTIFTSNYALPIKGCEHWPQLDNRLTLPNGDGITADAITGRLMEMCLPLAFDGENLRCREVS